MKEAMKQALEALEDAKTHGLVYVNEIVDLRQAIAASEKQGEPVGTAGELFTNSALERLDLRPSTKIYTTPQPKQEQGEPVAWEYCEEVFWHTNQNLNDYIRANGTPLYTTPQQRTWVGLTDEEIDKAWRSVDYTVPLEQLRIDIAQAIEAKLRRKNEKL